MAVHREITQFYLDEYWCATFEAGDHPEEDEVTIFTRKTQPGASITIRAEAIRELIKKMNEELPEF